MSDLVSPDHRFTIISSDCHAGGSHTQYREYLESKYHDDFDAWRGEYKNPYKDLGDDRKFRNWDNEMRNSQQLEDGVVGEVIFPNTIPPFFPGFVLFAGPPKSEDYEHRLAGIRAHNRWLADFCAEFPERRAGVGQVFFNDIDDAIEDLHWIKDNNLRGGVLIPNIPPDSHLPALFEPYYEPFWKEAAELEVPVTTHAGTGGPDYGDNPMGMMIFIAETAFYGQRPFVHMLMSGVFERHPNLKFVMTEMGSAWVPELLSTLDGFMAMMSSGQMGELRYGDEAKMAMSATDYFRQNCYMGVSLATPADVSSRHTIGLDRFMWGSDYPHDEGTHPNTRAHLKGILSGVPLDEIEMMLAGNAAKLYDFDLDALAPLAAEHGPTASEILEPAKLAVSGS